MTPPIRVTEQEINEVLAWAEEHGVGQTTDNPDGTYEEGVYDGIRWLLGQIRSRPDQ
jgi:hypothetical protein